MVAFLTMMAMGVVPIVYVRHKLAPLLAMLQPTDLRVTLRERTEAYARNISRKVLVVGIMCGLMLTVANFGIIANEAYEGRALEATIGNMLGALSGALSTAYVIWLIVCPTEACEGDSVTSTPGQTGRRRCSGRAQTSPRTD